MKIQMDANDLREAVGLLLNKRGFQGKNIDINLQSVDGAMKHMVVIVKEPLAEGVKPRTRRIPITGAV